MTMEVAFVATVRLLCIGMPEPIVGAMQVRQITSERSGETAGKLKRALSWYHRAVDLGNSDSNLDIAKHYLQNEHDPKRAIPFLNKVCKSDDVTETVQEEAKLLLKQAQAADVEIN
jgi:TPR repeat protein